MFKKLTKKFFDFLFKSKIGLLLLINIFFIAGLLAASGAWIGALIWFGSMVFIMVSFTVASKVGVSVKPSIDVSEKEVVVHLSGSEDVGKEKKREEDN